MTLSGEGGEKQKSKREPAWLFLFWGLVALALAALVLEDLILLRGGQS
jgi:hypothetical protein